MKEFNVFTATRAELQARIAELELFRIAFMEWTDKTDWVQTDKRFAVLNPWGKHRADVLKEYIQHLESRTVTVKLPDEIDVLLNHLEDVLPFEVFQLIDAHKWNAVSRLSAAGIKVEAE